jgi:3-methyladenine DNA glycosylase AlkD
MTQLAQKVIAKLEEVADPTRANVSASFFKTGVGQYAEGDIFIGITVPKQREIAKIFYAHATFDDLDVLLKNPIHEVRLTAWMIFELKYQKGDAKYADDAIDFFFAHKQYLNNWDLVDGIVPKTLGHYLVYAPKEKRAILYEFAKSAVLWDRRIAVLATYEFIRNDDYADTLRLCELLLDDSHDLMHKACGWMLREVGKRDVDVLKSFLDMHAKAMPRTMLRYAIEKLDDFERKSYLHM